MFAHESLNLLTKWGTEADFLMKKRRSLIHQVITDVRFPQSDARLFVSTVPGLLRPDATTAFATSNS